MRKAVIIIEDREDTNKRWSKALKGKMQRHDDNVIVCSSAKIAEKVFSEPRLSILRYIGKHEIKSIKELATLLKRDFKNVYNDVMFLADLGLIALKEATKGRSLRPVLIYEDIELSLIA